MPVMFSQKIAIGIAFTTNHFIFQKYLIYKQSLSVKKHLHSLSKLFSVYEEFPERSEETDCHCYFNHKLCGLSQRTARVSRGSNKNKVAINLFRFSDIETQQRCTLKKYPNPKKKMSSH